MYSLQLHPSIIAGTHPDPKYQAQVGKMRIEISRISGTAVFASSTETSFPNQIFESIAPNMSKSLANLIDLNVIVLKKDGTILTSEDANKLSYTYTKVA